ncbi:DUF2092 domain-containing protein [Lutibacter holmesii]|uniref:DUF2092 domain-containing protein n=1 Tax=Lutibacter holmesii TaxID=1137985 RepID=A0ABW3WKS0_9FLAO
MKNYSLFFALIFSVCITAQTKKIDPTAILILDHMNDVIGELESCSFELSSSYDKEDPDFGLVTNNLKATVIFSGPNKMLSRIEGSKGKKGFWYNGEQIAYYSYTENNYGIIDAPDNTIAAIDTLHFDYGIQFPAADFFYPAFTDDLLSDFDSIQYIGQNKIENEDCFHIKAENDKMIVQYWISNNAYRLPKRYLIIYKNNNNLQYQGTFNNWQANPKIPESIFEFTPPESAKEIKILAKKK